MTFFSLNHPCTVDTFPRTMHGDQDGEAEIRNNNITTTFQRKLFQMYQLHHMKLFDELKHVKYAFQILTFL